MTVGVETTGSTAKALIRAVDMQLPKHSCGLKPLHSLVVSTQRVLVSGTGARLLLLQHLSSKNSIHCITNMAGRFVRASKYRE
jgi:hypothetical protein